MRGKRQVSGGAPGGWESVIREKLERRRRKAQRWRKLVKKLLSVLTKANYLLTKPISWRTR